jgi:tol-pal system protein YbgF
MLALLMVINQVSSFAEIDSGSRIIDRLERMERDLVSLQRQFYREKPSDGSSPVVRSGGNVAEIDARVGNIEEKMRVLNGNIEQLQYESKKQQQLLSEILEKQNARQIEELKPKAKEEPVVKKPEVKKAKPAPKEPVIKDEPKILGKVAIKNINDDNNAIIEKDPEEQKPEIVEVDKDGGDKLKEGNKEDNAQELFDKSFTYLRSSNLENAERGFTKFIAQYKDHALVGNAYYWLGETFFIRKDYKQAGANFVKSYKESPNGAKAYEALIKLATSFSHLDKKKEACSVINKLNSFESKLSNNLKQRIKEEASRIGCN